VLLGGAVAWTLHLVFAYVIAEFGILSGFVERQWAGLDAVSWLLIGWSAAMLALAASAVRAAGSLPDDAGHGDETDRTVRFCAGFGRASNLVFLVIIAVQTIPIFYFLRLS
jgi:hypothetical protein